MATGASADVTFTVEMSQPGYVGLDGTFVLEPGPIDVQPHNDKTEENHERRKYRKMSVQRPSRLWLALIRGLLHPLRIIVLPILIYTVLSVKLSESTALAVSAIIPIFFIGYGLIKDHRLDTLSLLVLPMIALKLIVGLVFHAVKAQFLVEPVFLGGLGLVLIGSLLIGKPLLLFFASGPEEATPSVESTTMMSYRIALQKLSQKLGIDLRRLLRFLTGLVGANLFLAALLHVAIVYLLPKRGVVSLFLLLQVASYGINAIAVLVLIGYYVLHRQCLSKKKRSGSSSQREYVAPGRKTTKVPR